MSDKLTPQTMQDEGLFTVTRVRPIADENGDVTIATCGCGCHGSVSVSNIAPFSDDDGTEVLHLQK